MYATISQLQPLFCPMLNPIPCDFPQPTCFRRNQASTDKVYHSSIKLTPLEGAIPTFAAACPAMAVPLSS